MSDYGIQRLQALAKRLIVLTEQGKVEWREGAAQDSFQLAVPNASVSISTRDGDGRAPYVMEVFSGDGAVVDSIETEAWWDDETEEFYPRPWNELLERLYELARRNVLNIDAVLDTLLSELPAPEDEDQF